MRSIIRPAILLLLFTIEAAAQRRTRIPEIPLNNFPPGVNALRVQQKLATMIHARPGTMLHAQKTTAGTERMFAEATVDYNNSPIANDSMVFVYSPGRSSSFDFENLAYDFEEANNDFYPIQFGDYGHVDYDSLNYYGLSGSTSYQTPGTRSYNAAGKVTKAIQATDTILFSYDASGRLKTSQVITGVSYRDFYFYNAAGHLVKDSMESWDFMTSAWIPDGTYYHTVNAAGYPTKSELAYIFGSARLTVFESNNTYNGLNQVTGSLLKIYNGTGLRNYFKDTIGYAGAQQQYSDSYSWDTVTNSWTLFGQERRRMNAASLPDSVWSRDNFMGSWDTTIFKLAYNAQSNPVNKRVFFGNSSTAQIEHRWYYEPIINVSVKHLSAKADLLVYPNPASGILYLKGTTEGRYTVQNMAGQLLQSGTLKTGSVPVGILAPGLYSISLIDKAGVTHTARFVRQ